MKRIITAAMVAALAAAAGHTVSAQAGDQQPNRPAQGSTQTSGAQNGYDPNKPDPADKGGVFTLTGCLEQQPAAQGSPMAYKLTRISPATGEGRTAGAMGAGVGMGRQGVTEARQSDPPDIVPSEYRIVAAENVSLAPHANHKIEVRGSLSKNAGEAGATMANRTAANSGSQGRTASASSTADKSNDVFIATSVRMVSDTCSS